MTIRIRIDHSDEHISSTLDRTFTTVEDAAHFLALMEYYITRKSVGAMAKRFKKRERTVEDMNVK
jgi:hypothetical protein